MVQVLLALIAVVASFTLPIAIVFGLWVGEAHLGLQGYLIVWTALFVAVITPGVASAVLAGWLVDRRTAEGRRPYWILVGIVIVLQSASLAGVIYEVATAGANAGIAIGIALFIAVLTFAYLLIGETVGRRTAAREATDGATLTPSEPQKGEIAGHTTSTVILPTWRLSIGNIIWIMAGVFAPFAVTGLVISLLSSQLIDSDSVALHNLDVTLVSLFISLGFFAACLVSSGFLVPVTLKIRPLFKGSYALQKLVTAAVLKKSGPALDASHTGSAVAFASLMSRTLSLTGATFLSLCAGLITQQVSSLVQRHDDQGYEEVHRLLQGSSVVLIGVLVVCGGLFAAVLIRRRRRALDFLEAHSELVATGQ